MALERGAEVAAQVYDLTKEPNESVRAEINAAFDTLSKPESDAAAQQLVDNNILPSLVLEEFPHMDGNGDNSVDYTELMQAFESEDTTTRLAAYQANRFGVNGKFPSVTYESYSYDDAVANVDAHGESVRPVPTEETPLETPQETPQDPDLYQHTGDETTPEGEHQPLEITVNGWDPLAVLQNPDMDTEAQLNSIMALVKSGNPPTTIKDENGNDIQVRMEVVPVAEGSDRSYVHMFGIDPATGREIPILRAINDGTTFEHQRSADGEEVPFVGTKWKKAYPNTMYGD